MSNLGRRSIEQEWEILATALCHSGRGVTRLRGYRYLVGVSRFGRPIALVWQGAAQPVVSCAEIEAACQEAHEAGYDGPLQLWGGLCREEDGEGFLFEPLTLPYLQSLLPTEGIEDQAAA